MPHKEIPYYILILLLAPFLGYGKDVPVPVFTNPGESMVDAGHIKLIWSMGDIQQSLEAISFELQQSMDSTFHDKKVIYEGPDLATFISGLKNGNYYFRIRAVDENENARSSWTKPLLVKVRHHSLNMAFTLFGIGAVVFLLTCFVIIKGSIIDN